jgi:hypothetical protein
LAARKGVFGRLPRAAPNLTASIVSLVRAAQAQTDQNFVDAWKNGGQVDGKGVSDSRLLAHLKERRDQLSPDDPSYAMWNNQFQQYDFAIEESKTNLKYDQKKMTDSQVAAFYTKWANKPASQADGEFYRHLMDQAAKFNASAKAGRAAGSAKAAADAHNAWATNMVNKGGVQAAYDMNSGILQIAKRMGAAPENAKTLDDVYFNSAAWTAVVDVINTGKSDDPNVQGEIDGWTKKIQTHEPGFKWSESNINALNQKADRTHNTLIDKSRNKTERKMWTDEQGSMRQTGAAVKGAGAHERVQIATDTFSKRMDACAGDVFCMRDAAKTYQTSLLKERGNMTVQKGGSVTVDTVDSAGATTYLNTLNQLDSFISGKPITPLTGEAGAYTLIDAQMGISPASPKGTLATIGNGVNGGMKQIDAGGWISSDPMPPSPDGTPNVNDDGSPKWQTHVHDPREQPPDGYVSVPATTLMTDNTRTTDPGVLGGGGPVTKAPTLWVKPNAGQLSIQGPDGATVDQSGKGGVNIQGPNGTSPTPPWTELYGVPDAQGHTHTLYRVPNTDPATRAGNPYVYLDKPPVPPGTPMTTNGIPIVKATLGQDTKGNPVANIDPTGGGTWTRQIGMVTKPMASGNLPLGSFYTPGATTAALAIKDAYANGTTKDGITPAQQADKIMAGYGAAIEHLAPNDPVRLAAAHDTNQLTQTIGLYAKGGIGQVTDANYGTLNTRTPQQNTMAQSMGLGSLRGIPPDEMDRRIQLMQGLNTIDDNLKAKQDSMTTDWTQISGSRQFSAPAYVSDIAGQRAQLAAQRANIMNPTISVNNIKIPGMPNLFPQQPTLGSTVWTQGGPSYQPGVPPGPQYPAPGTTGGTPSGVKPHTNLNPGDGTTSSTGGPHGPVTGDPTAPTPVVTPKPGNATPQTFNNPTGVTTTPVLPADQGHIVNPLNRGTGPRTPF